MQYMMLQRNLQMFYQGIQSMMIGFHPIHVLLGNYIEYHLCSRFQRGNKFYTRLNLCKRYLYQYTAGMWMNSLRQPRLNMYLRDTVLVQVKQWDSRIQRDIVLQNQGSLSPQGNTSQLDTALYCYRISFFHTDPLNQQGSNIQPRIAFLQNIVQL
jgi:hypothetical protein